MGKCPVTKVRLPDDSTTWLATGFAETREVLVDQRYSRQLLYAPGRERRGLDELAEGSILALDPPEHSRLRKLVAAAFTARRIQSLQPGIAALVDDLITGMLAGPRPTDLVQAFSLPLPSKVICLLLGVPDEDTAQFHAWSTAMLGDASQDQGERMAALAGLGGYIAELITAKRAEPADDLISLLTDARDSEGKLSEFELIRFCVVLLIAGYETTANVLTLSLAALWRYPEQLRRLRDDPGLIPGAVEELLRYVNLLSAGTGALPRMTREEVCLGGVTIPAGETVTPAVNFANWDPAAFEDPARLDVGRAPKSHLAFGGGVHHCLGAQLARLELQEAFRGLLSRLPGLRMAVPESELEYRQNNAVTSMRALPVTWDDA
jgi:cytochrome P450